MQEASRDYEHLLRMAGLFVIGTAAFFVARAVMIPDDFGVYGHYRAGAIGDNAARPLTYAGQQACAVCHEERVEARAAGRHAKIHCESCHGARAAHAEDPSIEGPAIADVRQLCINCHARNAARPSWFPQVVVDEHAGDESCDSCHDPHAPGLDVD